MARIIALALAQPFRITAFNAKAFSRFLFLTLIALLFFLLVISIWQINGYSRDVFLLQAYSQKFKAATKQNETMEVNFNKANSLENFTFFVQNQPFERAAKIDYIRMDASKVVLKTTQ